MPSDKKGTRTFKVSPKGLISLAGSTLKRLGLQKSSGQTVVVTTSGKDVVIAAGRGDGNAVRISPRGVVELPPDAAQALGRSYVVKEDNGGKVVLSRA